MKPLPLLLLALGLSMAGYAAPPAGDPNAFESIIRPVAASPIDEHVFAALARLQLTPVACSDGVFLRRVYLDVIGTLPTAREARAFLQDPDLANKRRLLIDHLLAREEYARYWAMRWSDVLRIKAEFPVNLWPNAAQAYHRWVLAALAANQPYDTFARTLLTASGSNFRVGPANFYRALQNRKPDGIASAVALTFMGTRADRWPAARLNGMAVFFSQVGYKPTNEWKEEHVFWDPLGTATVEGNIAPGRAAVSAIGLTPVSPSAKPALARLSAGLVAVFPDGTELVLPPDRDPREIFADWLITPQNPWFVRSLVNRVWAWLLGRGIIHESDDIRPDNPPSNPALLAYLEREFVASRYDLKHLYRLILNSQTYQLSSLTRITSPEAEANFATYPLRRLDAEVLIDAINQIAGTSDLYTSPIPEPFTYIPEDQPAVAIADGSITSPFLALFGRSARATGTMSEKDNKPIPSQWLHLLNSSHIQRKLEQGPKLKALLDSGRNATTIIEELYLTILSRFPTAAESQRAAAYGSLQPVRPPATKVVGKPVTAAAAPTPKPVITKRREDWVDLAWSLLNTSEFLYRH